MAADRYKYFRVEAREILDQLGQGALDLEKDRPEAGSADRPEESEASAGSAGSARLGAGSR